MDQYCGLSRQGRQKKNLATLQTIVYALDNHVIVRLKETQEWFKSFHPTHSLLLKSLLEKFDISKIMKMFELYRNTTPNFIPSLFVFSKGIASISEMITDDNRKLLADHLYFFTQCQSNCSEFGEDINPTLMAQFFNLKERLTDIEKYNLSRLVEPPTRRRLSRRIKDTLIRPPLPSIDELLQLENPIPPLSPLSENNTPRRVRIDEDSLIISSPPVSPRPVSPRPVIQERSLTSNASIVSRSVPLERRSTTRHN